MGTASISLILSSLILRKTSSSVVHETPYAATPTLGKASSRAPKAAANADMSWPGSWSSASRRPSVSGAVSGSCRRSSESRPLAS